MHQLEPVPAKPGDLGKHIASQYFEAFLGHAAKLDQSLDEDPRNWLSALAKEHGVTIAKAAATRGDWIREAFAS